MKIEISKEFVLEAHKAACSNWKRRIEKELPDLFKLKLELNKWYIGNVDFDSFINIKSLEWCDYYHRIRYFGVCSRGDWKDNSSIANLDHEKSLRLATKEEIEEMLWEEAEKRGIGKDTKIEECLCLGNNVFMNKGTYICMYREIDDRLWNINGVIYEKGKFATPLNENKEIKETISRLEKEINQLKLKVK